MDGIERLGGILAGPIMLLARQQVLRFIQRNIPFVYDLRAARVLWSWSVFWLSNNTTRRTWRKVGNIVGLAVDDNPR